MSGIGISFGLDRLFLVVKELDLFTKLLNKSIKVLILKGMAISMQTRNFYSARFSSDFDLFISKTDLLKSIKILKKNGYSINNKYFHTKSSSIFKKSALNLNLSICSSRHKGFPL